MKIRFLIPFGLLIVAPPVLAHFPTMECAINSQYIECRTGFSDGTDAPNYPVQLFDYDDNLIDRQISDSHSRLRFKKPTGDFYLLFDAGHEAPVEIDGIELR